MEFFQFNGVSLISFVWCLCFFFKQLPLCLCCPLLSDLSWKLKTMKKTKRLIPHQSDGYVKMKCSSWKPKGTDNRDALIIQRPDPDVKHQFLEPQECRPVTSGSSQFLVSRSWKHCCCTADLSPCWVCSCFLQQLQSHQGSGQVSRPLDWPIPTSGCAV